MCLRNKDKEDPGNEPSARMRSEGYGSWVCRSVCRRFNSLLDSPFVSQTIPPTQRVTRISLIKGFFLKKLRCEDAASTAPVRLTTVGHFVGRNIAHELTHAVVGGAEARMCIVLTRGESRYTPFFPPWIGRRCSVL